MTRELIIHIGNHKTGSTSIQSALYENRTILEDHGFSLLTTNFRAKPVEWGGLNGWIACNDEPYIRPGLALALSRAGKNSVIISAENFSFISDSESVESFASEVQQYFDRVRIVCYLRRQDRHIVSHTQQCAKPSSDFDRSFLGFNPSTTRLSDRAIKYLDYSTRLQIWSNEFGRETLTIKIFEKRYLVDGDIVADFSALLGVPLTDKRRLKNKSWGFERTMIGHMMADMGLSATTRRLVTDRLRDTAPYRVTRSVAKSWYCSFKESNVRLSDTFGWRSGEVFDEDFDGYPERPFEWNKSNADGAIRTLISIIDGK